MITDVYMFIISITMVSVSLTCNSSLLATKIFFSLISFVLSALSLILAASTSNLLFINCTFIIMSLRISSFNTSLLKAFIPFVEVGALTLFKVDISLLSNVVEQYKQKQSMCNDHYLRNENQGVRR